MRTSTALRDDFGMEKSPEIPSLSNGVDAASPPLVVVGGIDFIGKRKAFLLRLVTSQCPTVQ